MADEPTNPEDSDDSTDDALQAGNGNARSTGIERLDIREEMRQSYLTYAMSVIISRALPDARDGLKPAQRRILVAMNDLNLGPNSARVKCAKISGDTSGNYHPHGEGVIYPTLVRLAQEWIMRETLVDKIVDIKKGDAEYRRKLLGLSTGRLISLHRGLARRAG